MRFELDGKKVVLVSRGHTVSSAIAEAFRTEGARVALADGTPSGTPVGTERFYAPVRSAIEQMGGLDILITFTGIEATGLIDEATTQTWQTGFSEPMKCTFFSTQAALPELKTSRGVVVNVTSILGLMGAQPGLAIPAAAMACAVQHTRMMALRLSTDGVRVNGMCHGYMSDLERNGLKSHRGESRDDLATGGVPLGRLGTPKDLTGSILFLASPLSAFMTGTILTNDGGAYGGN